LSDAGECLTNHIMNGKIIAFSRLADFLVAARGEKVLRQSLIGLVITPDEFVLRLVPGRICSPSCCLVVMRRMKRNGFGPTTDSCKTVGGLGSDAVSRHCSCRKTTTETQPR